MTNIDSEGIADANALRQVFQSRALDSETPTKAIKNRESIIIVGAGAFGSSLALELVTHHRHKYSPSYR